GIDQLTDEQERAKYADFINRNSLFPELSGDPSGDNWYYNTGSTDFRLINGTEGNRNSEIGQTSNTEDLNRNNVLDRTNSYFEYELNLDTSPNNPQLVGSGLNGWYQYRIPLINYKNKIGAPDFSLIEFARVWMTGYDSSMQVRIYDLNLVGNQWEEGKKNDSTFIVSTINIEDNPNYISPPGVIRERDKSQTDAVVLGNEQSLQLQINDLRDGQRREAIKRFTYKTLDMFNYKHLKMFVHASPNFSDNPNLPTANIFVRLGRDSLNFYEYKAPLVRGEDIPHPSGDLDAQRVWPAANNIDIEFAKLTAVKQGIDSSQTGQFINGTYYAPGTPYGIRGNPDLSRIAYISVGIENPNMPGTETSVTGDVWINELRLVDVDNHPGWAYSVSATLKLADLATIGFTYSKQDPYFHQLETAFGSRLESVNWSLTTSISLEKFLPSSWAGSSFPFTYSHTEGISAPKYLPASDVEVEKAASRQRDLYLMRGRSAQEAEYAYRQLIFETQTTRIADSYALPTFKLNMPYDSWLAQDIVNKMQFGFTYSTSFDRSPQKKVGTAWNWQATFGYAYTVNSDLSVMPFEVFEGVPVLNGLKDLKVFFPITNFSLKASASRGQISDWFRTLDMKKDAPNPTIRNFNASRGFSFGWKLTENGFLNLSGDYSVDIASTLVNLETDALGRQRGFYSILDRLVNGAELVSFGIDNSYMQNFNINSRPRVPDIFEINKYLTLTARYGVGYTWSNNLQLGELGKSTRWSNNISLSSDFSLKQFADSWWPAPKAETEEIGQPRQQNATPSRRRSRDDEDEGAAPAVQNGTQTRAPEAPDSTAAPADTIAARSHFDITEKMLSIARLIIKTPLLDFDKISISFTETNSASNTGVPRRPGFANFFGTVPFVTNSSLRFGPTWAYQMGLVSEPTANLTGIGWKTKFPFIVFETKDDLKWRAAQLPIGSTMPESFNQSNKLSLKTNRDLWEGARIDLQWNLGWDFARTQNIRIDPGRIQSSDTTREHVPVITGRVTGGSIERSFFTVPVFGSLLKSNLAEVAQIYKDKKGANPNASDDKVLSEAFEKGMETLPFLTKLFGQYMPRMNYALRWDGLEKYSVFASWASRVSLDHAYQSSYRRTFKSDPSGVERTETQRVMYGFQPLLGLSVTFKELLKGNMSANVRYSSTATYDLMTSAKNISESGSREMSVTASYGRSGFEIPFFGLALNNDVDISFSYSYAKSSRKTYGLATGTLDAAGTPGEGSSRTTMEPRIKYVLSARVTASLFYRYTKITPDEGGSRIPGSSTNEGGLDVHIAIQ
ncbi:MAG: cell surface protein SprA, partial [Acidobacteriota bacterium]